MDTELVSTISLGVIALVSLVWTTAGIFLLLQVLRNLHQLESSVTDLNRKIMPAVEKVNTNLVVLHELLESGKGPMEGAEKVVGNLVVASNQVKELSFSVRRLATPMAINMAGIMTGILSVMKWYLGKKEMEISNGQ